MKFVTEYRDQNLSEKYAQAIAQITTKPWVIMEVCGGQTHAIVKYGIDQLLPKEIELIHGPGCPVCVTPMQIIDQALAIARLPQVIFCSFGDMLRVPGSDQDLLSVKAQGGDVRIVYSPLDAVKLAQANPDKEIVFFAVGFETTAPATAMAVYQAAKQNINNFSLLISHFLVPPAINALLSSSQSRVQGFLAAGHVCTVMGYQEYEPLANKYHVPIVVTGFEPVDILQGIYLCVQQLEAGLTECVNQYTRSVQKTGNITAQNIINQVFSPVQQTWRGIGEIPASGLGLNLAYANFNAQTKFADHLPMAQNDQTECISGEIMQGLKKPHECPAFGTRCIPEKPLGAPMVSSEGACAAYYRYRQRQDSQN